MVYFPELSLLLPFLAACWVLQTSPGPDMVLVVGKGISFGRREALLCVLGIFLAVFVQAPLVAFGAAAVVAQSQLAYSVLKGIGAAYLIYLAINNLRSFMQVAKGRTVSKLQDRGNSIRDGFITNMTNPKVILFMLAFVPQFTDPMHEAIYVQLLVLIFIMKTNGLVVNGLVAIAAGSVRSWLSDRASEAKWQNLLIAFTFLVIAGWFILDIVRTSM